MHGALDGRYTTMYQYEFPRATRHKGKFLPRGAVRLREFLFSDGGHGQLVQILLISDEERTQGEQRVLVDKLLDISREDKRFREGTLTSAELTGEVRIYSQRQMICLSQVLAEQEKIGLFASARRVRNSRLRQKRVWRWRMRLRGAVVVVSLLAGLICGALLQKFGLFDLSQNPVYRDYLSPFLGWIRSILSRFG